MGGAITLSNREEKGPFMAAWHALDEMNMHIRTQLFLKPVFSAPCCSIELSARALTRDVERGDSKVPLGIALPLALLSLLRDRVSEHARYPSFSILLYHLKNFSNVYSSLSQPKDSLLDIPYISLVHTIL